MHATLKRRLGRLEQRLVVCKGKPRKTHRIVVRGMDREPSLENAACTRTLCPDGTLLEVVQLENSREGQEALSDEALDRFVESFPVKVLA